MNIFFLSRFPKACAKYHCDKHMKMVVELCQMMWCAFHMTGVDGWEKSVPDGIKIYKKTHVNHPTTVWVRTHRNNFIWTSKLTVELCKEYTRRYGKIHACQKIAMWFLKNIPECNDTSTMTTAVYASMDIPENCTPPPLCVPKEYHMKSVVGTYRKSYKLDKSRFATWKNRESPFWF